MQIYRAELHIHTVLSACAVRSNTAAEIFSKCVEHNIRLIAITDHNSAENVAPFMQLAKQFKINIIPAMEFETSEEVHLLCYFPTLELLSRWQSKVYQSLEGTGEHYFTINQEIISAEKGAPIGINKKPLYLPTTIALKDAVQMVHQLEGLAVPAHIDRFYKGLIPELGLFPADIPFDGLEISKNCNLKQLQQKYPLINKFSILKGGDVHAPDDMLGANLFYLKEPTFAELKKAFHNLEHRKIKMDL